MKIFIYILIAAAAGLLIYNTTLLDFGHLFEGDSAVAAIGILAAACCILLLSILLISFTIKARRKNISKK